MGKKMDTARAEYIEAMIEADYDLNREVNDRQHVATKVLCALAHLYVVAAFILTHMLRMVYCFAIDKSVEFMNKKPCWKW